VLPDSFVGVLVPTSLSCGAGAVMSPLPWYRLDGSRPARVTPRKVANPDYLAHPPGPLNGLTIVDKWPPIYIGFVAALSKNEQAMATKTTHLLKRVDYLADVAHEIRNSTNRRFFETVDSPHRVNELGRLYGFHLQSSNNALATAPLCLLKSFQS
jgi:hypothetical protein